MTILPPWFEPKSNPESNLPASRPASLIGLLITGVALVGFSDAAYLTAKYWLGGPLPCSIFDGCDTVTRSAYATLAGVPIALLGALFYLVFLVLGVWYFNSSRSDLKTVFLGLGTAGFGFSLYLVSLQIFVIKALCFYCLLSAGTATILFLLSLRAQKSI